MRFIVIGVTLLQIVYSVYGNKSGASKETLETFVPRMASKYKMTEKTEFEQDLIDRIALLVSFGSFVNLYVGIFEILSETIRS